MGKKIGVVANQSAEGIVTRFEEGETIEDGFDESIRKVNIGGDESCRGSLGSAVDVHSDALEMLGANKTHSLVQAFASWDRICQLGFVGERYWWDFV